MKRMRFPLFAKIIFWVFLNLLFVGGILMFIFNLDFRFSPRSPFFRESANRIEAVSRLISAEISDATEAERNEVLAKYSEAYNVEFFAFDENGVQIAGNKKEIPEQVTAELKNYISSLPQPQGIPPESLRQMDVNKTRNLPRMMPPGRPPFFVRTTNPTLYWSGSPMMLFNPRQNPQQNPPQRLVLLTASNSISGYGLFFDPTPWLVIIGVVTVFSILFWLPLVRSLTNAVAQVTEATEKIADEDFGVRVSEKRTDEIGRLGVAINQLATRLSGFVHGQKRFLGDISHELNSPLARLQLALTIIEDDADEKTRPYLLKAQDEVKLMSKLIGELLTYSKAGLQTQQVKLETVNLRETVDRVIAREKHKAEVEIEIDVPENLAVYANSEMLVRAVANIVRNAIRYAGNAGVIRIEATEEDSLVRLVIADSGAGVPDAELEKMFDPFYRLETHRSRETGGSGLGLAIVKTCVEACRGKVFARNRQPSGLEIRIVLQKSI